MTILNIYSLDDTENQNVIACLPEGKHVIGRGDLLQVTDKRVSRKHAVIEVSSDKIYLTSVHVNPCFFKAANGKTLSVLSQNQQNELNDGDQFALLPENYWFKVAINKEDGPLNGLGDSIADINEKRHHDNNLEENGFETDSKRARLSTVNHETSMHNTDNCTTSNMALDITNNIQNEASHSHPDNEEFDKHLHENADESNTSLNLAETAKITDETSENEDVKREIKEESIENADVLPNNLLNNSSNNTLNNEHNASTSNPKVKEEPLDNSNNEGDNVEKDIPPQNSSNNTLNNKHNASTSNPKVKEEPLDNSNNEGDNVEKNIPPQNNNTSSDPQPEVKTENQNDDNQNKDGASGSETGPKKVHREKCWYGDRCFRKNPNHRETFSHPGDQDYDSDPDDDRPECPFGTSCYRKNIDHRREYKHTGKPAPKPRPRSTSPNPPGSPTTQNKVPNQKKPRKAATKKPKPQVDIDSSQDDYDLEDPFINDASSDDFQPSDGIDSDSSDWEDSQEVDEESQERKRMLKEAKKFTKKGKK